MWEANVGWGMFISLTQFVSFRKSHKEIGIAQTALAGFVVMWFMIKRL